MIHDLAHVRRLEAVSFRSFPATKTRYDGTWAIRLTAGHPAKRLNSVNPLDPADRANLETRVRQAEHRFESFGRPFIFRLTPLAPPSLPEYLEDSGWFSIEESIVMLAHLGDIDLSDAVDQLPLQDAGLWVDAFIAMSGAERTLKPGLVEIISSTEPVTGLFLHAVNEDEPASAVRCVLDRDIAGIFDLVSSPDFRRCGNARLIVASALAWAKRNGASQAWLQVVAANQPAIALYESFGFSEMYRYRYWVPSNCPVNGAG